MTITIIGLGLIGGSMAIDLKNRGFATKIIGVDNNKQHSEQALKIGLVDEILSLENAVKIADIVIIATPVNVALNILPQVLNFSENQLVTDVCSTKESLCKIADNHQKRYNYVAAHPMAGTENSGPNAAITNLFDDRVNIFCDSEKSGKNQLELAEKMFNVLKMKPLYMNAKNHDEHVAYVSHISHISSFALALTVLEKEKNEKNILALAAGGFESTVRLAKSSAGMWTPIFTDNKENLVEVIDTYMDTLTDFKSAILSNDNNKIDDLILKANIIRKILN